MYAQVLSGPHHELGPEILNPTWAQIEEAIRQMNNNDLCSVSIGADATYLNSPWMGISGGNGQYMFFVTDPDFTNHVAFNSGRFCW